MARDIDVDAIITSIRLDEQASTPVSPGAGFSHIFAKADGLYIVDDSDAVTGPFAVETEDIGARVFNDASIDIVTVTATDLTFNSEIYDTDVIHSTSSNTERLTCKTAGKYIITASILWETNNTGYRILRLKHNGTDLVTYDTLFSISPDVGAGQTSSIILDLAVNEYMTCNVFHSRGANLEILYSGKISPYFMMQKIG